MSILDELDLTQCFSCLQLETVPIPDFKLDEEASLRENATYFKWSFVVDVPYGNYMFVRLALPVQSRCMN